MKISHLCIPIILLFTACGTNTKSSSFEDEFADWQKKRIERLKSKTGWVNLAGLYWLEEGENTIGSDSSNSIIFPKNAPAFIGKYLLEDGKVKSNGKKGVV